MLKSQVWILHIFAKINQKSPEPSFIRLFIEWNPIELCSIRFHIWYMDDKWNMDEVKSRRLQYRESGHSILFVFVINNYDLQKMLVTHL